MKLLARWFIDWGMWYVLLVWIALNVLEDAIPPQHPPLWEPCAPTDCVRQ